MKKFIHRVVTGIIAAFLILVVGTIALLCVNLALVFVGLIVIAKCLAFWIPLDQMVEVKKPSKAHRPSGDHQDKGPRNAQGIPLSHFHGGGSLN